MPEPVVGVLDVLGQVVPGGGLLLGGLHEVLDVLEVDAGEVAAPVGIGFLPNRRRRLQPQVEHPLAARSCGAEMSRTTSSLRPRLAVAPAESLSAQPYS